MVERIKVEDPEVLGHIQTWMGLKAQLDVLKKQEAEWRQYVTDRVFGTLTKTSQKADLPQGWALEAKRQPKASLDVAALPAVLEEVRKLECSPDSFIEYTPKLKAAELKKMPESVRTVMKGAIIREPGSLQLAIIPPGKLAEEVPDVPAE